MDRVRAVPGDGVDLDLRGAEHQPGLGVRAQQLPGPRGHSLRHTQLASGLIFPNNIVLSIFINFSFMLILSFTFYYLYVVKELQFTA